VGDPAANHNLGPVINKGALASMLGYVEAGKKESRLVAAAVRRRRRRRLFSGADRVCRRGSDAALAQEEIFGPVLAVIKVESFEEGLKVANNTEYGLTGSIYSTDRRS